MKKFKELKLMTEEKKDKYDEGEYDQEGDMAKSDLRSIMANSKKLHDMIEDADNLPEWCQNKITLAEDYISTVANYLTAEMSEEVKTVTVKHKTSGKELVVSPEKAKQLKPQGYHPVKEEVELDEGISDFDRQEKSRLVKARIATAKLASEPHDDKLLARTGMNMAHKFPRKGQTNLGNIPGMNTPGVSKDTADYAERRRGDRAKELKPAIKAALGTHGPKGKLPEEVDAAIGLAKPKTSLTAAAKTLAPQTRVAEGSKPPFDKPYTTIKDVITDKSGAKHTPMSRARDIARMAMKKQAEKMKQPVKESLDESRRMEIVREAMKVAKKKKETVVSDDKYQAEPMLSSQITKT